MRNVNVYRLVLFVFVIYAPFWGFPINAAETLPHPKTYLPSLIEIEKHKKFFDDPSPYLDTFGPKQILPAELYEQLSYNPREMKDLWAGLVGFRAPEVVGKIAPEIKAGTYSYKDKDKYPGLKSLMYKDLWDRFNPGAPPHAGNIPEFEVVPTRQYYYGLPIAEATKRNAGKTKLDDKGYLISDTWSAGYPFPKPSGKFKGQQIMYNVEKRYLAWGLNFSLLARVRGYTKDLDMDFDGVFNVSHVRLDGRVLMAPYGAFDNRAEKRGEFKTYQMSFLAPRDVAGAAQTALYYLDPNRSDQLMMYLPSLRRIRKMTATDSQDPIMGQDQIYDDNEGWMQKLSPTRYPYRFEVLEEREYLVVAPTLDGSTYIASDGLEFRNVKMERRPLYVIKLTQLDPNYVYSYRIFYIDRETFNFLHIESYDQKGRLYRTWDGNYSFFPEMGMTSWAGSFILMRDHLDLHSSIEQPYQLPAFWNRKDVSLKGLVKRAK